MVAPPVIAPTLKSFGAVGNGIADDTAAFQSAIAANIPILLLGDGTFLISASALTVTGPMRIMGNGSTRTKIKLAAATLSSAQTLLAIRNGQDVVFRGFSVDASSITQNPGNMSAVLLFQSIEGLTVEDISITTNSPNLILLSFNNINHFNIAGNNLTLTAPDTAANQAINISNASGACADGFVQYNVCKGTAIFFDASRTVVRNNDVSDWAYGGGITTSSSDSTTQGSNTITRNVIHDRHGIALDVNATAGAGVENWAPSSIISNNTLHDCGGPGVSQGGPNCTVSGNTAYNNGKCILASPGSCAGYQSRFADGTFNGSNTTFTNNVAYDTAGTQSYGYQDANASVSGVTVNQGHLLSGAIAQLNLNGSNTVVNQ